METEAQEIDRLLEKYDKLTKIIAADQEKIETHNAAVNKLYADAKTYGWESEWDFQEAVKAHTDSNYVTNMAMQGSLNQMWKTTSRLAELGIEVTDHA